MATRTLTVSSLICISVAVSLLGACRVKVHPVPISAIGEGGFLSQKPCGLPCFWGITPDITTEEEAIGILQQHVDVDDCSSPWPVAWDNSWIICAPVAVEIGVSGRFIAITFTPDQPMTAAMSFRNSAYLKLSLRMGSALAGTTHLQHQCRHPCSLAIFVQK